MLNVAILNSSKNEAHSTTWAFPWENYCIENNIDYTVLDPYDSDIIDKLRGYNLLLWHYSGYIYTDMLLAKNILFSAKKMGLKIFPDFNDSWHFDDKIAESYLLQSVNAPIPKSYFFYNMDSLSKKSDLQFPIIAKLRNGSGSHNVVLLNNRNELLKYAKKMFTKGVDSSPNLIYKTSSNIKSVKSFKQFYSRLKRVPEFLRTLSNAKEFPKEKGYVYLQSFVPNDGYDLKVVVIGDKLSFIGRNIRKGDFRASGGGDLFFDKTYIQKKLIDVAFKTSDDLGFNCMGYDFVVDGKTNEPKIIEISYGFSHSALLEANGYFDREGVWHEEPLNAPVEILKNLIKEINSSNY